jgi:hypothetical protein
VIDEHLLAKRQVDEAVGIELDDGGVVDAGTGVVPLI